MNIQEETEDRIDVNAELGNDPRLREQGIWDDVKLTFNKTLNDSAEEDVKASAMKPGEDGEQAIP